MQHNNVLFENVEQAAAAARTGPPTTKLLAFFDFMQAHALYRDLTYIELPAFATWHSKEKEWLPRRRGPLDDQGRHTAFVVGRMPNISPGSNLEAFHLRVLLNEVPGPTSYQDLLTVEGEQRETFTESCRARGLLQDDKEQVFPKHTSAVVQRVAPVQPKLFAKLSTPSFFLSRTAS